MEAGSDLIQVNRSGTHTQKHTPEIGSDSTRGMENDRRAQPLVPAIAPPGYSGRSTSESLVNGAALQADERKHNWNWNFSVIISRNEKLGATTWESLKH